MQTGVPRAPAPASVVVDCRTSPHARLRPVAAGAVRLEGGFWGPRVRLVTERALPAQWEELERSGCLDNFRRAAGRTDRPWRGLVFADSDLYKWMEAAAWSLVGAAEGPARAALLARLDEGVALVAAAQREDGYVNTHYSRERAAARFTNLKDDHELYCAGHLIQAAVAHRRATGTGALLDIARRFADLVCATFGPEADGRRPAIDGHEEIELALVELARETGDRRYLEQARWFVEARGRGLLGGNRFGEAYFQDHAPFRELPALAGHAVRALYYACGVTDVALETGDATLLGALERLFEHAAARRAYVTGGLGARYEGESFGADFELPNARAYTETCAGVAAVMWCQRMLLATRDARYADALEWTLYNAVLPGWSLEGTRYFYVNPLQDDGGHRRQPWFECACCPPNVARTVAALPGLAYATDAENLYVSVYAPGAAEVVVAGQTVRLAQKTDYPWSGEVELTLSEGGGSFGLALRVPAWCEAARLEVNGEAVGGAPAPGSWAVVSRAWRAGDRVTLRLELPVRALESHPRVLENAGRVALARGPLVYCLEGVDHAGADLRDVVVDPARPPRPAWRGDLLGGVVALAGEGEVAPPAAAWQGRLYRRARRPPEARPRRGLALLAVPYFAWANRAPGPMQLWLQGAP